MGYNIIGILIFFVFCGILFLGNEKPRAGVFAQRAKRQTTGNRGTQSHGSKVSDTYE